VEARKKNSVVVLNIKWQRRRTEDEDKQHHGLLKEEDRGFAMGVLFEVSLMKID
jgi:hypothetical protein